MTSVGVVGLGVIGRAVCRALDAGIEGLALAGATARDRTRGEAFLRTLSAPPPYLPLDQLIGAADLLVEASTQAHLAEWATVVDYFEKVDRASDRRQKETTSASAAKLRK